MSNLIQRRLANPDLELPESLHPLLRRIYSHRNLKSADELELGLGNLLAPDLFSGLEAATALLLEALQQQKRILIVSDFDTDGATSCVVAIQALRGFGCTQVDYIVPNRFEYGYGLTPEIVELAKKRQPDLIITVDNGISSIEGVAAARQAGIAVLITDHHLPAEATPAANAIVNPNQHGCDFPSKCIAGVGVIFYVMLALRAKLRELDWFSEQGLEQPNLASLLDLVALGTVADVVALDRNNRILVDAGLKRIRGGKACAGIAALLEVARRDDRKTTASDLGFSVGPRLNAAGRLDDMSTGIECLLTDHPGSAYKLALQLDQLNSDRKQIEAGMRDQAFKYLNELSIEVEALPAALCLFDSNWHQGVVGILASRVKDKYHRPVIAFAAVSSGNGGVTELKGSARSIKGFHIRDALDAVASRNPGLISKFGGHAMAAGLSLEADRFEEFQQAFQSEAARLLDPDQLQARIFSDGLVEPEYFCLEAAAALTWAGPWGQEFPEPVFDGKFNIINHRRVGENHLKLTLSPLPAPQQTLDAIAFNVAAGLWPGDDAREIEIAYKLQINEFRGRQTVQLMVEHILAYS